MPPSAMTVEYRRDLRHADAGDDARRADRAGPDADLQAVRAGRDQFTRRIDRRDVARDHVYLEFPLDLPDGLDHVV
jgi:hypothetical protein